MPKRKDKTENRDVTPEKKKKSEGQTFLEVYHELWNCLHASKKGQTYVYCSVCCRDFSCAHGGRDDCRRHVKCVQHTDYLKLKPHNKTMTDFCLTKIASHTDLTHIRSVTKAEVMLCEVIADMNLSLSSADHLTSAIKMMFPDSKIAKGMKCYRNKATAILVDLADITKETLISRMKTGPFTLSTDGSTDQASKQYPIVVRTTDPKCELVNSELLSIPICTGPATGQNIFELLDKELTNKGIPWKNCLSLGCDNASVMTGWKSGVFSFVKKKQPEIFLAGCTLHLVHIAAQKAAKVLPAIDELLVDIYYYFNKSEK